MAAIEWYYARGGEQFGPYSAADIKRLADAGKILPDDLVWRDGMDEWIAARKVKGIFGDAGGGAKPSAKRGSDFSVAPAPPAPSPRDDDTAEDAAVAAPEPEPADEAHPILFQPIPEKSAEPRFPEPKPAESKSRIEPAKPGFLSPLPPRPPAETSGHPIDGLLDFVRGQFPAPLIRSTAQLFAAVGHVAIYLVLVLSLVFALALAARTGRIEAVLLGLLGSLVLVMLQYAAGRFLAATERLMCRPEVSLASTALPNAMAVFPLVLGVALLLGHTAWAIHIRYYWLASAGVVSFIILEYLAFVTLSPATVGVRIGPAAGPAEEALGVLALLVRGWAQVAPVAYGAGVVWCGLRIAYGLFVLLSGDASVASLIAMYEAAWTIAFALLPAGAYFALLALGVTLGMIRGVLALADRAEQGRGADDSQALLP